MSVAEREFRPTADDATTDVEAGEDVQLALLDDRMFRAAARLAKDGLLKPTHLDLGALDGPLSFDQYVAVGGFLGAVNRSCAWWVGDWLVYGEGVYGEKFAQAATATGLAEQTLLNRAYVCRHIPPSRRIEGLAFGVHALVAAMPAREQKKWLAKAKAEGWTREDLRRALRETKATEKDEAGNALRPGPGEPLEPGVVLDAARQLVRARKDAGADWLVPKDKMARLIAAIGEEEE